MNLKTEPVLIIVNGAGGVIDAGLLAAKATGVLDIDLAGIAATVTFVTTFCGVVSASLRSLLDSPATVEQKVAVALATPPPAAG